MTTMISPWRGCDWLVMPVSLQFWVSDRQYLNCIYVYDYDFGMYTAKTYTSWLMVVMNISRIASICVLSVFESYLLIIYARALPSQLCFRSIYCHSDPHCILLLGCNFVSFPVPNSSTCVWCGAFFHWMTFEYKFWSSFLMAKLFYCIRVACPSLNCL